MLLAPELAMKGQHTTASVAAQKLRPWPLTQVMLPDLLRRH
jgi:hypothetical protein